MALKALKSCVFNRRGRFIEKILLVPELNKITRNDIFDELARETKFTFGEAFKNVLKKLRYASLETLLKFKI